MPAAQQLETSLFYELSLFRISLSPPGSLSAIQPVMTVFERYFSIIGTSIAIYASPAKSLSINKLTFNIFSYPHCFIGSLSCCFLGPRSPGGSFCCLGQGLTTARAHWQFPSLTAGTAVSTVQPACICLPVPRLLRDTPQGRRLKDSGTMKSASVPTIFSGLRVERLRGWRSRHAPSKQG